MVKPAIVGLPKKSDFFVPVQYLHSQLKLIRTITPSNSWPLKSTTKGTLRSSIIYYTVICFVSNSAKFAICTFVEINGTLVEVKLQTWDIWICVLHLVASSSVLFRLTTVQMSKFSLPITYREERLRDGKGTLPIKYWQGVEQLQR
jgi:hypothetical protein